MRIIDAHLCHVNIISRYQYRTSIVSIWSFPIFVLEQNRPSSLHHKLSVGFRIDAYTWIIFDMPLPHPQATYSIDPV